MSEEKTENRRIEVGRRKEKERREWRIKWGGEEKHKEE
jgi:hypothetical protein